MKLDTELLEISTLVNEKQFKRDLSEDLKVDKVNLLEELSQQPTLFAWWATLAEAAKDLSRKADLKVLLLEAKIGQEFRMIAARKTIRTTEKGLQEQMQRDARWLRAVNEKLEARKQASVLTACVAAMAQRASMLAALSGVFNRDLDLLKESSR